MPIDFREIEELRRSFNDLLSKFDKFIEEIRAEKECIEKQFLAKLNELKFFNFSLEELKNFIEEPYVLIPRRKDEYYVIVPKFIPMQIGWLHSRTKSYNIFIINKYIQWLYDLPEEIKSKIKFPTPLPLKVENGYLLTGKDLQETAWRKYRQYLTRREGEDKIRIKRGYEFRLIAKLIEDGILPFIPHPVDKNDLRYWNKIKLRSYQQKAWQKFLKTGAIGIYWVFGAGKSYFGIYCLARIKGRKLVVVPTLTLKEQWIKRIKEYIPEYRFEVDVITYASAHKVMRNQYTLTIFDECHRLPANTYIKLATIKTKYRIGLSGSPFREDKRENYIFALTGFPVGLDWSELIELGVVAVPKFKLYIVKNNREKIERLEELLRIPVKTIIFCDSIDMGKKLSKKFNIPFVYGATKDRLETIKKHNQVIVSRVGDEGVSLPEIERIIEVSFLYGSRMQESQRFGRLMHSTIEEEPEHNIIMTEEEFQKYQKRLLAIYERGFKIQIIR